jgi:sulfur carrier protein
MNSIELFVNGQPRAFAGPVSVAELLERDGLAGKRVAVERNGQIVPRADHASTLLGSGDRLEIVVAVGGG